MVLSTRLLTILICLSVMSCGADITFDDGARDHIEAYDPDRATSDFDGGVPDVGLDGPVEAVEVRSHVAWDGLLRAHVRGACFDYGRNESDAEALDVLTSYLAQLERASLDGLDANDRRALWINAYNAYTVAGIIASRREDPAFRVDVADFAFFRGVRWVVAGRVLSLDLIEHGVLRGDANHASMQALDDPDLREFIDSEHAEVGDFDARIHFALNCGSTSCPDLAPRAYVGSSLDQQLSEQATRFLDNPDKGAGEDGISMLFDWFRPDFETAGTIPEFIAMHRSEGLPPADAATFLTYDWALNDYDSAAPQCDDP